MGRWASLQGNRQQEMWNAAAETVIESSEAPHQIRGPQLYFYSLELPAGDGIGEILGVLVLAEGHLPSDAKDTASGRFENLTHIAVEFAVVDFGGLFPHGTVFVVFGGTLADYG